MIAEYLHQIRDAAPVIVSLILIEGLLSVDNMLAIAALASQLPENQKKSALRIGLAGAYVFRIAALFLAGFIIHNEWVKFLGAFYLIHLMAEHFNELAEEGETTNEAHRPKPRSFWATVIAIQIMDLSLSVDNVVTAVAMSPLLWVVILGVCLGLLTLLLFATLSLKLVEKFPILQHTAFLLIGYVGLILLVEMTWRYFYHVDLHFTAVQKFIGIAAIMLLSILYDLSPAVQRACRPLFHIVRVPIRIYSGFGGMLIGAVACPFKKVCGVFQKTS